MPVTIGIVTETVPGETRVALVPEVLRKYQKAGVRIAMQSGAGTRAGLPDTEYQDAAIESDATAVLSKSDVLLKVQPPSLDEVRALKPGAILIGYLQPHRQQEMITLLCERKLTSFAVELIPRISRAQSMDALSSQASVAGYKAVLIGASALPKFLPMLTTAAGTIRPAQVLVMGAGVAGPAGDRDRAAPRRRGRGLRRAPGHEGAGQIAGRQVRRTRASRPKARAATRASSPPRSVRSSRRWSMSALPGRTS